RLPIEEKEGSRTKWDLGRFAGKFAGAVKDKAEEVVDELETLGKHAVETIKERLPTEQKEGSRTRWGFGRLSGKLDRAVKDKSVQAVDDLESLSQDAGSRWGLGRWVGKVVGAVKEKTEKAVDRLETLGETAVETIKEKGDNMEISQSLSDVKVPTDWNNNLELPVSTSDMIPKPMYDESSLSVSSPSKEVIEKELQQAMDEFNAKQKEGLDEESLNIHLGDSDSGAPAPVADFDVNSGDAFDVAQPNPDISFNVNDADDSFGVQEHQIIPEHSFDATQQEIVPQTLDLNVEKNQEPIENTLDFGSVDMLPAKPAVAESTPQEETFKVDGSSSVDAQTGPAKEDVMTINFG
ncbi:hypothetical protein LOTGIDRAFT_176415, partial [Lottia gigantea]